MTQDLKISLTERALVLETLHASTRALRDCCANMHVGNAWHVAQDALQRIANMERALQAPAQKDAP